MTVDRKEKWTVRELKPGDILRVDTGRYYHFGIYIGDETVIHFAGPDPHTLTDASMAAVRKDSLQHFAMGKSLEVRAAESQLGQGGYDIIYNNCEHFVNKCAFGIAWSTQIDEMRSALDK